MKVIRTTNRKKERKKEKKGRKNGRNKERKKDGRKETRKRKKQAKKEKGKKKRKEKKERETWKKKEKEKTDGKERKEEERGRKSIITKAHTSLGPTLRRTRTQTARQTGTNAAVPQPSDRKSLILDYLQSTQPGELPPARMHTWTRRNHVQITCNPSGAYHVQHAVCRVVRTHSSAIHVDRVEIAFMFRLYFIHSCCLLVA